MKLLTTDHCPLPLPQSHRFPAVKYQRLRDRIEASRNPDWELIPTSPATDREILRAHSPEFLHRVVNGNMTRDEIRQLGFPWSPALVKRSRHSVGGTLEAARTALAEGIAIHLAGGTHHAARDAAAGFCVFNDVVIAARALQSENGLRSVAIIDADVHQGDGTASIVAGDRSIFAFSIHGARNYPFRKVPGDLDIALPDQTTDEPYLEAFATGVAHVLRYHKPELVLYLAGADPYEHDRFSRFRITKPGLARRDDFFFSECRRAQIPVAVTMAGGYSPNIEDILDIHEATVQSAAQHWSMWNNAVTHDAYPEGHHAC